MRVCCRQERRAYRAWRLEGRLSRACRQLLGVPTGARAPTASLQREAVCFMPVRLVHRVHATAQCKLGLTHRSSCRANVVHVSRWALTSWLDRCSLHSTPQH